MLNKVLSVTAAAAALFGSSGYAQAAFCQGDLDGDGSIGFSDLTMVLAAWGPCGGGDCAADLDGDAMVGFVDLTALLGNWGVCETPAILTLDLAGLPLTGYPHFTSYELFTNEQTIRIGVDPAVAPDLIGRPLDAYVVSARTLAQWRANQTLADVRGAAQSIVLSGPGLAGSVVALDGVLFSDGGLGFGVAYDLVLDADGDGQLSDGDAIDGFGDEPGFTVVGDLTAPGPLTVFTEDFEAGPLVIQRVYYPASIGATGALPLIVISHGTYMDYRWYDYLGEHLASHGYVVMTHFTDNMEGITTPDPVAIASAAFTTLTNTEYLLANQATVLDGVLDGHLDNHRIVWIGHSRGGEGVVRAYDAVRDGDFVPSTFGIDDIALISSIAPSTWLDWTGATPGNVPYHLLYGAADGDVYGGPGGPAGHLVQAFRIFERAYGWRSATYVHGADHNDFNCCGIIDDFCLEYTGGPCDTALAIGRDEAQRVAKATYLALFKHLLDGHAVAAEFLWRQHENLQYPGVSAETIIDREFREGIDAGNFVIDDFQTQLSPSVSSSGGAVTFSVSNIFEGKLTESDMSLAWMGTEPMNGMTRTGPLDWSFGAVFDYVGDAFLEFAIIPSERDWTDARCLSFRACQGTRHPLTTSELGDLDFSVTLRDDSGTTSTIRIGAYGGGIEEPFQRSGQGAGIGWANEFETICIRLTDFTADGSGLDLSNVVAVRFEFGPSHGSAFGRLGFDDVEIIRD